MRNEEKERNTSPVSFYSSFEAPTSSPRRSRQSSIVVDTSRATLTPGSPTPHDSSTSARLPKLNGSPAAVPSRSSRIASERSATGRGPDDPSSPAKRSASAQHAQDVSGPSSSAVPMSLSDYSWQSEALPQNQKISQGLLAPDDKAHNSAASRKASVSTSKSANSFAQLDDGASTRPRSKSTASASRSSNKSSSATSQPLSDRNAIVPEMPPPSSQTSSQTSKTLPSAPSKVSLRSRIFGLKSNKNVSPSISSADSGTETPSPRSAHFPASVHSEGSQSESIHFEASDSPSVDPDLPSPGFLSSSHGHARDTSDEAVENSNLDARSSRKSSGASGFLRKTMRFKDKSAFLKSRPSISSMASDSAASTSGSVPPSLRTLQAAQTPRMQPNERLPTDRSAVAEVHNIKSRNSIRMLYLLLLLGVATNPLLP